MERRDENLRELWIHGGLSLSEEFALWRASQEESYEICGISEARNIMSACVPELLREWGMVLPLITSSPHIPQWEEEEQGERSLAMGLMDTGVCDLLLWNNPHLLWKAWKLSQEQDWDLPAACDWLLFHLGEAVEYGEGMIKTVGTVASPEIWEDLFHLGRQRVVLHPNLAQTLEPIPELEKQWESFLKDRRKRAHDHGEAFPDHPHFDENPLLLLYLYVEPQAFVLEEKGVHIHTTGEERGWLHFTEGHDIYLADRVNEKRWTEWVLGRTKD